MSKILVAYFSASGVTRKVAKTMAKAADADLFEIVPEVPYTSADLDWTNPKSRSSAEMRDKSFRPAVAPGARVADMARYDAVLLGFPIWWYVAPTIVNTFLEQYDMSGKKIALFATSGSSGMGNSARELAPSAPGATFVGEKRVSSGIGVERAKVWIDGLKL